MAREILGPFLTLDKIDDAQMHLAAIFVAGEETEVPPIVSAGMPFEPKALARVADQVVWCVRFTVRSDADSSYSWYGTTYALSSDVSADLRIAFASCNGEEHGDLERDPEERNAMWARLCQQHEAAPFSLLLHGGDQIYADEATKGHALSQGWPKQIPSDATPEALDDLRSHLRQRFFERYTALLSDRHYAWLCARVPSLCQWDDHDICDGWGSLPRKATSSTVGQVLFSVAKEMALLFQHGAVAGDLPARFHSRDATHLGWHVTVGDLSIVAPDLRSQRGRRQVMGLEGWLMMEEVARNSAASRTFLMSSVPLLGPRLSLLESLMLIVPFIQKYEDDLRDQWQSRAHREAWKRMLTLLVGMVSCERSVTVLSGEIHLATRATMAVAPGRVLHQLVASGVTHRPPPKIWARVLGALATLGQSPLARHPIVIERIPGQSTRYVAERNVLLLERQGGVWQASWVFETQGETARLAL